MKRFTCYNQKVLFNKQKLVHKFMVSICFKLRFICIVQKI